MSSESGAPLGEMEREREAALARMRCLAEGSVMNGPSADGLAVVRSIVWLDARLKEVEAFRAGMEDENAGPHKTDDELWAGFVAWEKKNRPTSESVPSTSPDPEPDEERERLARKFENLGRLSRGIAERAAHAGSDAESRDRRRIARECDVLVKALRHQTSVGEPEKGDAVEGRPGRVLNGWAWDWEGGWRFREDGAQAPGNASYSTLTIHALLGFEQPPLHTENPRTPEQPQEHRVEFDPMPAKGRLPELPGFTATIIEGETAREETWRNLYEAWRKRAEEAEALLPAPAQPPSEPDAPTGQQDADERLVRLLADNEDPDPRAADSAYPLERPVAPHAIRALARVAATRHDVSTLLGMTGRLTTRVDALEQPARDPLPVSSGQHEAGGFTADEWRVRLFGVAETLERLRAFCRDTIPPVFEDRSQFDAALQDAIHELRKRALPVSSGQDKEAVYVADLLAWPIPDVLERLAEAVEHLLDDHSCDRHGYESWTYARNAALQHVAAMRAAPQPSPKLTREQMRERAHEALRRAHHTRSEVGGLDIHAEADRLIADLMGAE